MIAAILLGISLCGCSSITYYQQAVAGQLEILSKRRTVQDVLADPGVAEEVKDRLDLAREILNFAEAELGLPVEDTFDSYVDIGRSYVVWNVFSANEFSMALETFCYPIAGCVTYKGYFNEQDALSFAEEQRALELDVYMGGVTAYSTLGWFADPLLNTFIHRTDARLAALIFHELAHKVVYLPGDTTFNESFATAVERYALRTWLSAGKQNAAYGRYLNVSDRRSQVTRLILQARSDLTDVYKQDITDENKRKRKEAIIFDLKQSYLALKRTWAEGNEFEYWMETEINNAKIGAIGAYQEWVAAFSELLAQSGSFNEFIREAKLLGELPQDERQPRLVSLTAMNKQR